MLHWRNARWAGVAIAMASLTHAVLAQTSQDVPQSPEVQQRLDLLEKQNRLLQDTVSNLQETVRGLQNTPPSSFVEPVAVKEGQPSPEVRKAVEDVLKEQSRVKAEADAANKKKTEAEGHVVGSLLNYTGSWRKSQLWFDNADKSFSFHISGRAQYDIIGVTTNDTVMFGKGGIGPFDDSAGFRRARLGAATTMWETINTEIEFDFVNTTQALSGVNAVPKFDKSGKIIDVTTTTTTTTYNTPVPTDLWIEFTQIPLLGNVRIGNQKAPIGFEHLTSSRFLNFLERSYQFDAFLEDGQNGFTNGIQAYNTTEDERATGAIGVFKTTRNIFGFNVGDGEWGCTTRVTWLPVWEDDGRCLVHLGMGAEYRGLDDNQLRLRSRTELRNGPASLHNIVAISQIQATEGQLLLNPEFVVQMGPFILQSEYNYSQLDGATKIIRTPTQTNVTISQRNYATQGAYVEMLYFLTGEYRLYNKKIPAFARVVPNNNAYWVKDEDGGSIFSMGAWQVGARYAWLDLNNNDILGGEVNSLTLGVNWFLNPNSKIQWNYEIARRSVGINSPGYANGDYQGVGVRFAFDF